MKASAQRADALKMTKFYYSTCKQLSGFKKDLSLDRLAVGEDVTKYWWFNHLVLLVHFFLEEFF